MTGPHLFERPQRGTDDVTVMAALSIVNFHDSGLLRMRGLSNFEPAGVALKVEPERSWLYISYPTLWNVLPYLAHWPLAQMAPKLKELPNALYFVRVYNFLVDRVGLLLIAYLFLLTLLPRLLPGLSDPASVAGALLVLVPMSLNPLFLYDTQNVYFVDQAVLPPIFLMLLVYLRAEDGARDRGMLLLAFLASFLACGIEWLGILVAASVAVLEFFRIGRAFSPYLKAHAAGMAAAVGLYGAQLLWYPNGVRQLLGRFLQRAGLGESTPVAFEQMMRVTQVIFDPLLVPWATAFWALGGIGVLALVLLWCVGRSLGLMSKASLVLSVLFYAPLVHALVLREHYASFSHGQMKLFCVFLVPMLAVPYFIFRAASGGRVVTAAMLSFTLFAGAWLAVPLPSQYRRLVEADELPRFRAGLSTLALTLREFFPEDRLVVSPVHYFDQNSLQPVYHLENFVYNQRIFKWLVKNDRFEPEQVRMDSAVLLVFTEQEKRCASDVCSSESSFIRKNGFLFCRSRVDKLLASSVCYAD